MKYELTTDKIEFGGRKLCRIKAVKDFCDVKKGDIGGYIEDFRNLSQNGDCWVYGDAKVYGNAEVWGNAKIYGNTEVYDKSKVYGDAIVNGTAVVCGDARVSGNAVVYGDAKVCGDANVCGNAVLCDNAVVCSRTDYIVFQNWWSSGRYVTWTRSNDKWCVGCFFGSGEELINKAYKDSDVSGREYKRIVDYVESVKPYLNNIEGGKEDKK